MTFTLDRIDIKILDVLQQNGRITNVELADLVALSPSPCLKRIRKLEELGYICFYGAVIDMAKLGDFVTVFTEFTLDQHHQHNFHEFEKILAAYPEVVECHLISGGYDYLVKFVSKSISHYQTMVERIIQEKAMVKEYFSYIVIKTPIEQRGVALESLLKINP